MSLSLRQLEVVRAVCRHGSVTAAAGALDISQPAVSMMLHDCARIAGFPLFLRRQGRLQPTSETRGLLGELERVFEGVERIGRLLEDMRETSMGSVRVAVTPTLADNLLPAAAALLRAARPRIRLTILTMDNVAVIDAVTVERVDFGLVLTPFAHPTARLVPICAGALVCVVPPGHPLAGRGTVTPHDLAPYELISFSRNLPLGALVEAAFRSSGVPRRIGLEVNQSSLACAMARAGAGVAVIDPFLLRDPRDHGVIALRLLPETTVTAQALLAREAVLSRAASMLLATLRRVARGAAPGDFA